jgi:excisionase family DNA binding protein
VSADDAARLAFVAKALAEFRDRCAVNGAAMPLGLEAALAVATGRQAAPLLVSTVDDPHTVAMTYRDAAARLGVSERTVDRLIAAGELVAVDIGGCARVRLTDLRAYVDGLRRRRAAA